MAGEVTCAQCGAANAEAARTCTNCGQPLVAAKAKAGRSIARANGPVTPGGGAPRKSGAAIPAVPKPAPPPSAPPARKDSLIGQTLSDYVIQERIGVGGMGVVYRAVQPMIGKEVAIKVLRPDVVADPRDVERLLEEARIVNSIKNRGIINIFGAGSLEDGRHYLIMELLEGESLEQKMTREGQLQLPETVQILEEVLSALAAAHQAGVVHRDLKPANIFLVKEGPKFYVKLLDFGLARRQKEDFSRIAGTPDYISPEHARGRPAGPPADLYAFGILCFHMLTGQLPFTGTTPMEVMEKHVHHAPPVPHEVNPNIPKALSELILKLFAKEPRERPDAAQVKADLRAATRQFRNATTMMSLDGVKASHDDGPPIDTKRSVELKVKAEVADLKRKVTRRWPYVLGGVVGLWFVAVVAYVAWPTAKDDPSLKPTKNPKNPLTQVDARRDAGLSVRVPVVHDAGAAVAVGPEVVPVTPTARDSGGEVAVAPEEQDAGESTAALDINAVLSDFELAERKKSKNIDGELDDLKVVMAGDKKKARYFHETYQKVRDLCSNARTERNLMDCTDELKALRDDFYKLQ